MSAQALLSADATACGMLFEAAACKLKLQASGDDEKEARCAAAVALAAERRCAERVRALELETLARLATPHGTPWEHCTSSMKDDARKRAANVRDAILAALETT